MPRLAMSQRRQLLIEAAWQVMSTQGVQAATTRAICAQAGMPQSSFHYCFESRAELLRIVVTGLIPRQLDSSFAAFDPAAGHGQTIRAALESYWADVLERPMEHAVLYDITMTALHDEELSDLAGFQYDQYHDAGLRILNGAAEALGLAWRTPVDVLATRLITFVDGITLRYLATKDRERCEAAIASFADDLAGHVGPPPTS